jgi:3-phosphoshikimate 1-carboxyvinyltransferase
VTTIIVEETEKIDGVIFAPSSKSYTHRAVIAASLAEGKSRIDSPLFSDDTIATMDACSALGANIEKSEDGLIIFGTSILKSPEHQIDCRNSASTIRFLTPITALAHGKTVLTGNIGLRKRPIGPLINSLQQFGVRCFSSGGFPPVTVLNGGIRGGRISLVGNISSQFITGLLFACPLAENDSEIRLETNLESKPYVRLTLDVLKKHGIFIRTTHQLKSFQILKKQKYIAKNHRVPGDFSSAAFLLAAAVITKSCITVKNVSHNQPDSGIVEILKIMGVNVNVDVEKNSVQIVNGKLDAAEIDASDIPDLVPVCSVLGCFSKGVTKIYNAKRLRFKESNRLHALTSELRKMGAEIMETDDGLIINGPCKLYGTSINTHGDHRIAMACAVAGLKAKGKTKILQAECVNKSYPKFFIDLEKLGANVYVE